jgi:predicted ester cyclase
MLKVFYAAFPDARHTFEDFVAEGDKVALRFTFKGTHTGDFQGIPPTGKPVTISGSVVDRIVDGKIVEHWSLIDTMGLMQQLGVIPEPAQ